VNCVIRHHVHCSAAEFALDGQTVARGVVARRWRSRADCDRSGAGGPNRHASLMVFFYLNRMLAER
jgi:hypothetical protein